MTCYISEWTEGEFGWSEPFRLEVQLTLEKGVLMLCPLQFPSEPSFLNNKMSHSLHYDRTLEEKSIDTPMAKKAFPL